MSLTCRMTAEVPPIFTAEPFATTAVTSSCSPLEYKVNNHLTCLLHSCKKQNTNRSVRYCASFTHKYIYHKISTIIFEEVNPCPFLWEAGTQLFINYLLGLELFS